jgi:copper resistance protein D
MDEALILCRALHYSAAIMLFGASVFQETSPPTDLARFIAPPMRRLAALAIVIIFLTTIAWLMLESGEMGGGWVDASATVHIPLR